MNFFPDNFTPANKPKPVPVVKPTLRRSGERSQWGVWVNPVVNHYNWGDPYSDKSTVSSWGGRLDTTNPPNWM